MSLETKSYVAAPADIAALARAHSEAVTASATVRGHYLRALVATTQHDLGVKPRLRDPRCPWPGVLFAYCNLKNTRV